MTLQHRTNARITPPKHRQPDSSPTTTAHLLGHSVCNPMHHRALTRHNVGHPAHCCKLLCVVVGLV